MKIQQKALTAILSLCLLVLFGLCIGDHQAVASASSVGIVSNSKHAEIIDQRDSDTEYVGTRITLILDYDICPCSCLKNDGKDVASAQAAYSAHLKEQKAYYSVKNRQYLEKLNVQRSKAISSSDYAPFVSISFANEKDFNQMLQRVTENKFAGIGASTVFISGTVDQSVGEEIENPQRAVINSGQSENYSLSDAKTAVGLTDATTTGSEIVIGVFVDSISNGVPTSRSGLFVSSMLNSIAPGADKVYRATGNSDDFLMTMNSMVATEASVICFCSGITDPTVNGTYSEQGAYLDFLAKYNGVTSVALAGNGSGGYIDPVGMGFNVITVGSVDKDGDISSFSSCSVAQGYECFKKPTLVAPGGGLYTATGDYYYGTEYSAAFVAGAIALLSEAMPGIIGKPASVMTMLIATAKNTSNMSNTWDNEAGAGLLRYDLAEVAMLSSDMFESSAVTAGTVVCEFEFAAFRNRNIQIAAVWPANNLNITNLSNMVANYAVDVYYGDTLFVTSNEVGPNIEYFNFNTGSGSFLKTFTIKVRLVTTRPYTLSSDCGGVTWTYAQ